jgi:hypothetical protein
MGLIRFSQTPEYLEAVHRLFTLYVDWGKDTKPKTDRATVASASVEHDCKLLLFKGNDEDLKAVFEFIEKRKMKI